MNEFLLLLLGFDRMFTLAMKHCHQKCDLFIYFVNLLNKKIT